MNTCSLIAQDDIVWYQNDDFITRDRFNPLPDII